MTDTVQLLYNSIGGDEPPPDAPRVVVHGNQVLGTRLVPGLEVDSEERPNGVRARLTVARDVTIEQQVHLCFGLLPTSGAQHIELEVTMERGSAADVLAHCTFPHAEDITHSMDAVIEVAEGASYSYLERHIHGPEGGVLVLPKARVRVGPQAHFRTEFELVKGRVGRIDIDYECHVEADAVLEMVARIAGRGSDEIRIDEKGVLEGERARGVLTSYIAVRDDARAEVRNTLRATAPAARGHVDCKEIVQDRAKASAVPIVDVAHPKAHITHEASIGSVDSKQLATLMARGLSEDDAVELIIQGLLS
jgi:Fe-S cluster assembly scaffold protein SufB